MRAIASAEARETMMWMGVVSCSGFCVVVSLFLLPHLPSINKVMT